MNRLEKIEAFVAKQVEIRKEAMRVADLSSKGHTLSPKDFQAWNDYDGNMNHNMAVAMLELLLPVVKAADKLADSDLYDTHVLGNENEWDAAVTALHNALADVRSTEFVSSIKGSTS